MEDVDKYIDNIVELISLGVCPDCKNQWLNDWCMSCQMFNGIKRIEAIEKQWTKDKILQVCRERAIS